MRTQWKQPSFWMTLALANVSAQPRTLRVELTNHCNLRCKMCGIWSEKPKRTLSPRTYEQILSQPSLAHVRLISLTGGEPFLLKELDDYYHIARRVRPHAHVNISSNGYYTDRTLGFLQKTEPGTVSLTISYDGVRSHDHVRGVEGSAARLLETATAVRDRFPGVPLALKLTVTNDNYAEITETAHQCATLGIAFRFKTLEKLNCHQNRSPSEVSGPDYSPEVIESIRASAQSVMHSGVHSNRRYLSRLADKFAGTPTSCSCSERTVFLGVDGKVFLCRKKEPIGNVFETSFDAIWNAPERRVRLREMRTCPGDPLELGFTND